MPYLFIFPEYPYARDLLDQLIADNDRLIVDNDLGAVHGKAFVFNDLLENFAEVTTVVFDRD